MKGKTVIVTGASRGMGKYMAKKFAYEGANVVITGRKEKKVSDVKKEFKDEAKDDITTITMDVRRQEDVTQLIDETVKTYDQIDCLVNHAAGNYICPAEELSINGWTTVTDIVLNATFYCTQEVAKHWIQI